MVCLDLERHGGLVPVPFGEQHEICAETSSMMQGLGLGGKARGVLASPQFRLIPEWCSRKAVSVSVGTDTGSSCIHKQRH
ncbi:unnamed protein product [Cochlearia groenlandica]